MASHHHQNAARPPEVLIPKPALLASSEARSDPGIRPANVDRGAGDWSDQGSQGAAAVSVAELVEGQRRTASDRCRRMFGYGSFPRRMPRRSPAWPSPSGSGSSCVLVSSTLRAARHPGVRRVLWWTGSSSSDVGAPPAKQLRGLKPYPLFRERAIAAWRLFGAQRVLDVMSLLIAGVKMS